MVELIHKELCYDVRGVMFDVFNHLGPNLPERFYQDAAIVGLKARGIACVAEKQFQVLYHGVEVGRYYVDIWIENGDMLAELKVAPLLMPLHKAQAISYLKVTDADLALLVNFGQSSLVDVRLPNFVRDKRVLFHWERQTAVADRLFPDLTDELLGSCHRVHAKLGPGFFHHVYRRAIMVELREKSIGFEFIKEMPVYYKETRLGIQPVRLILVEDKLLVAAVAAQTLNKMMEAQLKARMKYFNARLGLLTNFHGEKLDFAIVR
ncbi:MAG TPA: GxxExxY protein [Anaerolineae bacterium]|nr:GxxExxY protein [Anaerolineae bacterium]HIP71215.1 GxxExxY protein [Anaerolineae bacterium]